MELGGFTQFAHLRLRDHRPGNGDYTLPPGFGPKSDSSKRTILGKYPSPPPESGAVGPGDYPIATSIGTGRATRFAAPDSVPATNTSTKETARAAGPLPVVTEPKQYSMALAPDTPAYSIYGKLKGDWEASPTGEIGPGAYTIPSTFDPTTRGVQPGAHFGLRAEGAEERERAQVPGPGSYNITGFADEVLKRPPQVDSVPHRRRKKSEYTPGPGAYDSDPHSIARRTAAPTNRFTDVSTFGGRRRVKEDVTPGPGPAAYNVDRAADILERHRRHAPRMQPSTQKRDTSDVSGSPPPQCPTDSPAMPSDFDYNYRKGFSMLGRWKTREDEAQLAGPGSYDTTSRAATVVGGRFSAKPFDPLLSERQRAEAEAEAQQHARELALDGPGTIYDINYAPAEKRQTRGAVFGGAHDQHVSAYDDGVPGPGHYNPNYDVKEKTGKGTVFYKGDFLSRYRQHETTGAGPGAHYNDDTPYSQSIAGDRANNKGFTMRIRYPARATHQVAPPYDEGTNINCVYPDELTFETRMKMSGGAPQ